MHEESWGSWKLNFLPGFTKLIYVGSGKLGRSERRPSRLLHSSSWCGDEEGAMAAHGWGWGWGASSIGTRQEQQNVGKPENSDFFSLVTHIVQVLCILSGQDNANERLKKIINQENRTKVCELGQVGVTIMLGTSLVIFDYNINMPFFSTCYFYYIVVWF